MKKIITFLLAMMLTNTIAFGITVSGTGTSGDPYLITSLDDLKWIADQVNAGTDFSGKYFKQTANINASSTSTWDSGKGWMPIGYASDGGFSTFYNFAGKYDGQNYTISNLYMNRSPFYCGGLFGITFGATISNVGLSNISLTASTGQWLGALVGYAYQNTVIDNCYATGNISGDINTGGLIGCLDGVGGDNSLSNSFFSGNVNAKYSGGGICADASVGNSITQCYSAGSVTCTTYYTGGFIGNCGCTVSNCYSTSTVNGGQYSGGLIGAAYNTAIFNYCYATGTVSGTSNVGGLIGYNFSIPTLTGCLWDTQTTGQLTSADGGTGKTTAEMKTKSTFTNAGWDFAGETANGSADYWGIGSGYPYLLSLGMKITTTDFSSGTEDIPAFTKTYLNTDFTITLVSHNYSSIESNSGFNGFYSYDYNTANGTEFTISAPGYSFDLSAFKYYLESTRLPSLTVTLTFIDGSTDTKTYTFTGASTGVYSFTSFTTTANDVKSIKFVSDNYMTFNNFAIDDIKVLPTKPTVTTTAISIYDAISATMGGNVTIDGGASVTERGVVYSSSDATPTIGEAGVTKNANGTGIGSFNKSIIGLTANTMYYVRAYATNIAGTNYGTQLSFTTTAIAPTVITVDASSIASTTATLNGTVNANNASTVVTFEYGTTTAYGTTATAAQSPVTGTSATIVTYALTGLVPNTTYYYRVKGVNTAGTTNGSQMSFKTTAIAPSVTTVAATSITSTDATLNGIVNANNASTVVTFEYGSTTGYGTTVTAVQSPVTGTSAIAVSKEITGLTPNTTYHFRVTSSSVGGIAVGDDFTFKTNATSTAVDTPAANTSIALYPNPCTDGFNVTGIDESADITITDLTGRVVVKTVVEVDGYVSMGDLKQGTYLVKVNQRVLKLIKK